MAVEVYYSVSRLCFHLNLQDLLAPEELRALLASAHRPNFAIQMMAGEWTPGEQPTYPAYLYDYRTK